MKCCNCGANLGMFKKYAPLSDGAICKKCFESLGFDFNNAADFADAKCREIQSGYGYYMNSRQTNVSTQSSTIELNVVGFDFKQDELKSLLECENEDYTLSKKDFLENVAERAYQYEIEYYPAEIVHEENEHDPNALAVYVEDVHIGYIARKDQKKIDFDQIASAEVEIYGGKYKEVDYNDYEETIVKGETPYKARIYIKIKNGEH